MTCELIPDYRYMLTHGGPAFIGDYVGETAQGFHVFTRHDPRGSGHGKLVAWNLSMIYTIQPVEAS